MFTSIQHLCADNDRNGNPRRIYALVDEEGYYLAAWNEGYHGHHAVPGPWRQAAYEARPRRFSVREYNRVLREVPTYQWAHDVPGYEHLRMV